MDIEYIAKIAHEVNRAYCEAIGDDSQPAWDSAPTWQKKSAIQGVAHFIENQDATPEVMHENWMREKIADGWVYGLYKNPENKEHPCLVPYKELPQRQRVKDYLFLAVCKTIIDYENEWREIDVY